MEVKVQVGKKRGRVTEAVRRKEAGGVHGRKKWKRGSQAGKYAGRRGQTGRGRGSLRGW